MVKLLTGNWVIPNKLSALERSNQDRNPKIKREQSYPFPPAPRVIPVAKL
jgi:hypothetical protein